MVLIGGLKKYFLNVDQLLSIIPPCWISLYFVMMEEEEIKVGCGGFVVSRIHLLFNNNWMKDDSLRFIRLIAGDV
jgi:hypothetical protein